MKDTVTLRDRLKLAKFVLTSSKLTAGPKVREFEDRWSDWLGCDYSLFVSSGSTDFNFLLVSAMKESMGGIMEIKFLFLLVLGLLMSLLLFN